MTSYTTSKNDFEGPFLHNLPAKMEAMKGLPKLAYTSAREALATATKPGMNGPL